VLSSDLGRNAGYRDWNSSWFYSVPSSKFYDSTSIIPPPFPSKFFTIHQLSYHSTLYNLCKGRDAKWSTKYTVQIHCDQSIINLRAQQEQCRVTEQTGDSTVQWTSQWQHMEPCTLTSSMSIYICSNQRNRISNCESIDLHLHLRIIPRNCDSAVGIATGYGLDVRGVGVRVHVGSRMICSLRGPDRLWGPPSLLSNGHWGLFPLG
jgi:hypothetical protein